MDISTSVASQSTFSQPTTTARVNVPQLIQAHCSPSGRLDSQNLANALHQAIKQDPASGTELCQQVLQCLQQDHSPLDTRYFAQDMINSLKSDPSVKLPESTANEESLLDQLSRFVSGWHFEGRAERNSQLPSYEEAIAPGSEWQLLSEAQSVFHDNGKGKPELKFIHPDGREAVFDGDTLQLVTDDKYVGTYNYVNPAPVPDKWHDIGGWADYAGKGLGHLVLDVLPYAIGGNVRGEN